ncbi:1,4-alpha-glucan branching protein GlgB [Zafaria sp. Z1313]|uniref:1,4-alpha-glucan branching protein GlgB n=1 Tax=unclassified Zafaria TaxID=2828765 RepID=UPI002E764E4F|nr:1,4-alpha-glucan branching protein GlgB [Zafaria sp. J156]MEE1622019.1 1,4-alpha-glucan branching protein GlgB [Zafaria sp. J156]
MTDEDAPLLDLLSAWLRGQRWFPERGTGFALRRVGTVPLPSPADGVELESVLLGVFPSPVASPAPERDAAVPVPAPDAPAPRASAVPSAVVHVPLSYRRVPLGAAETTADDAGAPQALIGVLPAPGRRAAAAWHVYDGTHDPAFVAAWLELVRTGGAGPGFAGHAAAGFDERAPFDGGISAGVLHGEQSNTSVVVESVEGDVIAKFFRLPATGTNPDVELGSLLTDGGSFDVPLTYGSLTADWTGPDGPASGALGVLREFIGGSQDAWRTASAAALDGLDFTPQAEEIGRTTARLHRDLARVAGSAPAPGAEGDGFVDSLRHRLQWGWQKAGAAVGPFEGAFRAVLDGLDGAAAMLPPLQRIHGDYHLGQVLHAEGRGWVVLDFEGEPLRTAGERTGTDVPLRDVVGMLRSFDYAGAIAARAPGAAEDAERAAREWSARARKAFLTGYEAESGTAVDTGSPLFLGLWLDKALYEVVYELQNRPSWVSVPASAVQEVLSVMSTPNEPSTPAVAPASTPASAPAQPLPVAGDVLEAVAHGAYHAPHAVLGAHLDATGHLTVRSLRRLAESVAVVTADGAFPMRHEHGGIWVAVLPPSGREGHVPDYRIEVAYAGGEPQTVDDPYRYLPTLGEVDLHLIGEGRHEKLWTALGAHVRRYHSSLGDSTGTSFAVWAPNARAARVKGDFNAWDGSVHAMRSLGHSGVWELFIPGVAAGAVYKFEFLGRDGHWREKADPLARQTEVPPLTGSVVTESNYGFQDADWMAARAAKDPHQAAMSVYEVHLGSWRPGLGYRELAEQLVEYVSWQGFTHVEFMPVAEHPFGGSWGYQVTGYYAPTSRFGSPDDFRYLVDKLHQAGIGVILDWVPAHFPKDEWALARFDGEPLYEHADPRRGEHPDWGTLIFDFGRNEVRNFLVANALYWLTEFHIDGLRVDAVASMLYLDYSREDGQWYPNVHGGRENLEAIGFLQEATATAYRVCPGIVMVAEESTAFDGVTRPTSSGGLGFGIKWNMGWMHDSLEYMGEDPINRVHHHNKLTFSLVYAWTENFMLPISHDEVVHGKGSLLRRMPGDRWRQLAQVRAYLAFQWAHPGKQLIFMGTEFAQEAEWSEQHGLDWWLADTHQHRGVQLLVRGLNAVYAERPALWEKDNDPSGFTWIDSHDGAGNTVAFIRWSASGEPLVAVANFSGEPRHGYRLGLPSAGEWGEVLNTDAEEYGGSGVGNAGAVVAVPEQEKGQPAHAVVSLPPLGVVYFTRNAEAAQA